MTKFIEDYMNIIQQKYNIWEKTRPEWNNAEMYLKWLIDEVKEVWDEIKDKNSIYLEDELWDILWDYLNVLFYLEKEWKITSWKKVFERSFGKYTERVSDQWKWILWKQTKEKQKARLQEEHKTRYQE